MNHDITFVKKMIRIKSLLVLTRIDHPQPLSLFIFLERRESNFMSLSDRYDGLLFLEFHIELFSPTNGVIVTLTNGGCLDFG